MADAEALETLREEIESLAARLDDLIYEELAAAVERDETTRPDQERRLTRARNALLRAKSILEGDAGVGEEP